MEGNGDTLALFPDPDDAGVASVAELDGGQGLCLAKILQIEATHPAPGDIDGGLKRLNLCLFDGQFHVAVVSGLVAKATFGGDIQCAGRDRAGALRLGCRQRRCRPRWFGFRPGRDGLWRRNRQRGWFRRCAGGHGQGEKEVGSAAHGQIGVLVPGNHASKSFSRHNANYRHYQQG